MFSKSSMKEDDIKSLIYAVKKEFQQEINALNDRISNLERKNQHLEEYNNNLNTFIQHHFERLDRKTDENHTYILNMWNPFMQSTIEKVKDDLIKSINDNKKDDIELSKKVDKLTVQVSDLNKMVVDENPLFGNILVGNYYHSGNDFLNQNDYPIFICDTDNNYGDDILNIFNSRTHVINGCSGGNILFYLESLSKLKKIKKINLNLFTKYYINIKYKNDIIYKNTTRQTGIPPLIDIKTKKIIEDYCKSIGIKCVYE